MDNAFILKLAATTTYSPTASASRNYIPKKPSIKPGVVKINGADEKKDLDVKFFNNDTPKNSKNTNIDPDNEDTFRRFTNTFRNDISGTGYGRPYWTSDIARNAYQNI